MLVQDMNVPMVDKDQKEDRKKVLVDYFLEDRHNHELYAYTFFACEFLNFVNVLLQLLFMNFFLGGEFTTYGSDVISMTNLEQEQRSDPLSRVFPKVTQFDSTLIMSLILRSGLMLLNFQIHCTSHQLLCSSDHLHLEVPLQHQEVFCLLVGTTRPPRHQQLQFQQLHF